MPDPLSVRRPHPALAAWDRFFFTPADPRPLGLIRIATGLLLLWSLGSMAADLDGFLGSRGWADQSVLSEMRKSSEALEWSLWDAVPDRMLPVAWGGAMLVLLAFTLGLASRVTAPLAWAIAVSTSRRNPLVLYGFDQIVGLWALYLAACGASGRAYSLDRLIARRRGRGSPPEATIGANLGLRLIQISLAIIYGAAGLAKVRGMSWWDGSAVLKTLGNAEFRPFDLTWILGLPGGLYSLNLATHLGLWTELLYPVLIWKPGFRRPMLVAAVVMHVGIALTLGLTEFSLAMIAGNLAFVRWGHGPAPANLLESPEGTAAEPRPGRPANPPRRPQR